MSVPSRFPTNFTDQQEKQNENAAEKRSLLNFVDWCVNTVEVENDDGEITFGRRAKNYALIFSGHSLGFQDIGLFKDESSGKSMTMFDLY
jgi:predicted alpha/beta hydrolase